MKRILLATLIGGSLVSSAQHGSYVEIFRQMENIPSYYSLLMEEYTYDINRDLNRSFYLNLQTGAAVLDTGEFTVGIIGGLGLNVPHEAPLSSPLYSDRNFRLQNGAVPTVFNNATDPLLMFYFVNPNSGQILLNPDSGEPLGYEIDVPAGLGLPFSVTPSTALSFGYGLGYGTEVRAYITPKFGAAAAAVADDVSFSNDYALGLSAKHDISTWIPSLSDKGWHVSIDAAYSYFGATTSTDIIDLENVTVDYNADYTVEVVSTFSSLDYQLTTYGSRLFVGKSFSWIDFSVFGGVLVNNFQSVSEGGIEATLIDKTGNNPDENLVLTNLSDFEGSSSDFVFGASTTIGKGWFRTSLGLAYSESLFYSLGLNFHL